MYVGDGRPERCAPAGRASALATWLVSVAMAFSGIATASGQPADPERAPRSFFTQHVGTFNSTRVAYTATVAETILSNDKGEPTGSVFTIGYVADEVRDPANRPVMFIFNGGPGSSSVWLHMGAFGPKRVPLPDDLAAGSSAPYEFVDNERTLLDVADLVFLDPLGTGFSRVLSDEKKAEFFSTEGDAEYLAEVINRWIHAHGRENSPKYILGESYGTIRAPVLAQKLYESHSATTVNGLILIGPAVTLGDTATRPGNILAYALALPYMAATARYHGQVDPDLGFEEFLDEAHRFALTEYLPALAQGRKLPESQRAEIADKLERFTGLSAAYFLRNELAIKKTEFRFELLREAGRVLGTDDSRYTAPAPGGLQGDTPVDPSRHAVTSAYVAGLNRHLRDNLRVELPQTYAVFADLSQWDWGPPGSPFSNYSWAGVLSALMKGNPDMRLFYGVGYYDPKTTIGATEFTIARADYPLERVELHGYPAGHMVYTDDESFRQLVSDVREFIQPNGRRKGE